MQPGNMDAQHQMRLLFGQMDNPMMMPMQMPILIPSTTSAATAVSSAAKTSDKDKDKDKSKGLEPVTLPGYSMPGMSPYPYGMFPYTAGMSPMQMPLMLPMGASPFMPYNLFPYPGMVTPKNSDAKSGTALLKELSNNSKKAHGGKGSPGPAKNTTNKQSSSFERGPDVRARHSPLPTTAADGKKFSDIVQSAIMEGFRETEKDKRRDKEKYKIPKSHDAPLDFTTKPRASQVREPPRKPKERPKHEEYLHLLQKTSLHHKQVKEKDKTNTAKLKIEALIDFGPKKPTLSNLKLNLEKELEENIKASTFSAGSERYNFSPDTTFRGDERKNWYHGEHRGKQTLDPRDTFHKTDRYKSANLTKKLSRDMGLYPGEIPKHFGDNLTLSSERDFEDSDVLRGEAHQVRLARYNAQRLRMNSFYKSDSYTYVEQVEPDSTGDLQDEPGEISPKVKFERMDQERKSKSSPDLFKESIFPATGPPAKRPRVESPLVRPPQHSSLQDLKVDSSDVGSERTDLSPPAKDNTVRDKILSYIKSRSKRKRDVSPIPTLLPDMPVQDLKLQPGLSIVDSWKHQLAPSLETTAQATLEEMVLQHWRQSLANDYYQASSVAKNFKDISESAVGSLDVVTKADKERFQEQLDLEPGEVYRPGKLSVSPKKGSPIPKKSRTPSPHCQSLLTVDPDRSGSTVFKPESRSPPPILTDTTVKVTNTGIPGSSRSNVVKKDIKRKTDSPFSILDIMGDLGKSIPSVCNEVPETPAVEQVKTAPALFATDFKSSEVGPITDTLSSPESLNGSSSEAEKDHTLLCLSPKPCLSFSDSDTSMKSKKHRCDDDANTVSAEFALEAVKALDCLANLTSIPSSTPAEKTKVDVDVPSEASMQSEPLKSGQAFTSIGRFSAKSVKKYNRKLKKRRKKLKSLSQKNTMSKQLQPPGDPDMSVMACTDISNVNLPKDLAFTGLFTDKNKANMPANGSVHHRGRGRPPKNRSSGFSFGEKRRKPGRPSKVKGDQKKAAALSKSVNTAGNVTVADSNLGVEQPQRKKRSPLFYGCNYNDTLLISALRIKLPKSEKKLKKKIVKDDSAPKQCEGQLTTAPDIKESNISETVTVNADLASSDLLENVALSTLRQTKECSVLLKDVSSYLTEEKNMNVRESPFSERTESEKENKEEGSSGAGSRCESPVRVFSRPQVAKRSKPWTTKQNLAGNRLVLRRDPLKNGYFVKYSDALREESEKLGPNEISCDTIDNVVNSIVCTPSSSQDGDSSEFLVESEESQNVENDDDDVFESCPKPDDSECAKCELEVEKKPSLVDRFKATLLREISGQARRGMSQRSRSTDDLTEIKSKKQKPKQLKNQVKIVVDLYKNGSAAPPSEREERVTALKERLKLQQAAVAEIQWKMLESGAQSE
ncbi:uncharacterized protein LOC135487583 isoform X2 [Lineus longissimus]